MPAAHVKLTPPRTVSIVQDGRIIQEWQDPHIYQQVMQDRLTAQDLFQLAEQAGRLAVGAAKDYEVRGKQIATTLVPTYTGLPSSMVQRNLGGWTRSTQDVKPGLSHQDLKAAIEGEGWAINDYGEKMARATDQQRAVLVHIQTEEKEHLEMLMGLMACSPSSTGPAFMGPGESRPVQLQGLQDGSYWLMPDGTILEIATGTHKLYAEKHLGRALERGEDACKPYQKASGAIYLSLYGIGKGAQHYTKPSAAQQEVLNTLQDKYPSIEISDFSEVG